MGLDIGVVTRSFPGNEDRSWIGHRRGMDSCRSITLDVSTFTYPDHFALGVLQSGIALGQITASGLYGPYAGGGGPVDQIDSLVVDALAGTFTLTFGGHTTADIPCNATAAQVQAAINLLTGVNPGDIIVGGGPGGLEVGPGEEIGGPPTHPFKFFFLGQYADLVETLTADGSGLTGTTPTNGGTPAATLTASESGPDTAATDGRQHFKGFLFSSTRVGHAIPGGSDKDTAADVGAALFWEGIVKVTHLPVFAGGTLDGVIDAAAIAAAPHIRFEA